MALTATALLNACRTELGYRESTNNNSKYGKWYGLNFQPYCAMGLSYVASALKGSDILLGKFASCPRWVTAFQQAGRWYGYTVTAQPGDIVFFDWTGRHSHAAHVGIVERVERGVLVTIEFNTTSGLSGDQSDGGGVWRRRRATRWVVGYGRPAYGAQVATVKLSTATVAPLVIDGVWGAATTRHLQRWLGLTPTGVLNPTTRQRLQSKVKVAADGQWGTITRKALQRMLGVTADGEWGSATVKALQRFLNRVVT